MELKFRIFWWMLIKVVNGEYDIVGVGLIRIGREKEWKKIFMGKIKS